MVAVEAGMPARARSWAARMAGAALALLVLGAAHAGEKVSFPATRGYTAPDVMLRAEVQRPEGTGPFPAVVLMHGCGGWQPVVRYTMHRYAERFVQEGFVVLDLDSFGPRTLGNGKVCESVARQQDALDYRTWDAQDALHYLQSQPDVDPRRIFLMGQSNGGSVAINVAKGDGPAHPGAAPGFRAVVAYYPWCGSFGHRQVNLAAPLLVFGGARDDWVPARECEGVRSSGAALQLVIYPQAAHSFDLDIVPQRYLGNLVGKDPFAAQDSLQRMLSFFTQYAGGRTLHAAAAR